MRVLAGLLAFMLSLSLHGFASASVKSVLSGDDPTIGSKLEDDVAALKARLRRPGNGSRAVSAKSRKVIQRFVVACDVNGGGGEESADALCPRALNTCALLGESGVLYWIYEAPAGPPIGEWVMVGQACRAPSEAPEAVVPVFTAEDFRRLPLPAGGVHVEPPNLRTLINVPTNVYVDADRVIIPTELLGFPVRVRATPARFIWRFGDGGKLATTDAGAPYPDLRTTHTYTRPGRARVRLTTVYSGEYSVAGGPWLPIDGTAQVDSPGRVLTVLAAENRLVVE
jgi:hypothetical protein